MGTRCLIGLGSNLGDRKAHLDFAIAALSTTPGVTVQALSSYRETVPVGGPLGQGPFLNAALEIETSKTPETLLDRLNAIEHEDGRVRSEVWGERTLDLDLLLFGTMVLETRRLEIPHPRMLVRRFVLAPLAEIAPDFVEPSTGMTIASLLANLDRRPSYVALLRQGGNWPLIYSRLVDALSAVELSDRTGVPLNGDGLRQDGVEGCFRLLEQTAAELRKDRWTRDHLGDRWVVTDFWFDRIDFLARSTLAPSRFATFHDRFLELRPDLIAPTFLVVDRRNPGSEIRAEWSEAAPLFAAPCRPLPILRPDTDDPDQLASEILAACHATRTG